MLFLNIPFFEVIIIKQKTQAKIHMKFFSRENQSWIFEDEYWNFDYGYKGLEASVGYIKS